MTAQNQPIPGTELSEAWQLLDTATSRISTEPRLADLALQVVAAQPGHPAAQRVLFEVARGTAAHPDRLVTAFSMLTAVAERRGIDAPLLSEPNPALHAANEARRALEAPDGESMTPAQRARIWAARANALRWCGIAHDGAGQDAFASAFELDDAQSTWWHWLAELHLWRGRYAQGLECCDKALNLNSDARVQRTAAACATALGDGVRAAEAWQALGLTATVDDKSGMPAVSDLTDVWVRVPSRGDGHAHDVVPNAALAFELVSVARLSPCHGVVQTPTFRDAVCDYGDVILLEPTPVASHEGKDVFAVLQLLVPGTEHRWPFVMLAQDQDADGHPGREGLEASLPAVVFFWERSVAAALERGKLVIPENTALPDFANAWEDALKKHRIRAALPGLYEALKATKRAGEEHQRWRNIETLAVRRSGA